MPAQPVGIDQQMAFGIAIVSVDADHGHGLRRLHRQLKTVAQLHAQTPRQLFTEHDCATARQLLPGPRAVFQQRPACAIAGVIDDALDLYRPLLQA
ncbi:hypothetical protein D3C84_734430 [compost metagenome]